jgi:hypothetical protein
MFSDNASDYQLVEKEAVAGGQGGIAPMLFEELYKGATEDFGFVGQ